MSNDLEHLFNRLEGDFDLASPKAGHEKRFMEKLQNAPEQKKQNGRFKWLPFVGIAATIALLFSIAVLNTNRQDQTGLASVSPEMAKAESFFISTIAAELKKLNQAENTNTKLIVKDALVQLKKLENDYDLLMLDLSKSGNDQRVIYAMISNFQSRIDILQNTLKQIELINQLKNKHYETNKTL